MQYVRLPHKERELMFPSSMVYFKKHNQGHTLVLAGSYLIELEDVPYDVFLQNFALCLEQGYSILDFVAEPATETEEETCSSD